MVPKMNYFFHPSARFELDKAIDYYEQCQDEEKNMQEYRIETTIRKEFEDRFSVTNVHIVVNEILGGLC